MDRTSKKRWFFALVYVLSLLSLRDIVEAGDGATRTDTVRVALYKKRSAVIISSASRFRFIDEATSRSVVAKPWSYWRVSAVWGGIKVGDVTLGGRVRIESDGGLITVGMRRYRGEIEIIQKDGWLLVINELPFEEYLYGVLPREVPHLWPHEALKAQAVASRTFALFHVEYNSSDAPGGERGYREYDLESSVSAQVYGGYDSERESTNRAVDDTRGLVMTYRGNLIQAYFHSNSGGYTESAENVWRTVGKQDYLVSVEDPYSREASDYSWTTSLSLSRIRAILLSVGYNLGELYDIEPVLVSPSGRVVKLAVKHSRGVEIVWANDWRIWMGPERIRSLLFTMERRGQTIVFNGRGFGHGVGLSQSSAKLMADMGIGFEDILKYFYRGVEIIPYKRLEGKGEEKRRWNEPYQLRRQYPVRD
ncbi:MAG: SpoIID/LytB domain-containing protein [bacterium]